MLITIGQKALVIYAKMMLMIYLFLELSMFVTFSIFSGNEASGNH